MLLGQRLPGGAVARPVAQRYAKVGGSDAAVGDFSRPWATAQKLWNSTPAGQRGVLLAGGGDFTAGITSSVTNPGGTGKARRKRICGIRGQTRPRITARTVMEYTATGYYWLEDIRFHNGTASQHSIEAYGTGWDIRRCDLSRQNQTDGSCIHCGFADANRRATDARIIHCDFHDVAVSVTGDNHDHAIYLNNCDGVYLGDLVAWGILEGFAWHVYSDTASGINNDVTIRNCTSDGNYQGMIFAVNGALGTCTNVKVQKCIFSNGPAGGRYFVERLGTVGTGNELTETHVYNPVAGFGTTGIDAAVASGGITVSGTTGPSDPQYVNAAARDYRLQAGSPAAGRGARR